MMCRQETDYSNVYKHEKETREPQFDKRVLAQVLELEIVMQPNRLIRKFEYN